MVWGIKQSAYPELNLIELSLVIIYFYSGDFLQLPPVLEEFIFCKNNMDGRPDCSPSHWDNNYKIYFLTEKMRSMTDPKFGDVCDRISTGTITAEDETYLKSLVRKSPNENNNELYKTGQMSIIVPTNAKREKINNEKLDKLLKDNPEFICESRDQSTNISNPPELGDELNYTKTGNLQKKVKTESGCTNYDYCK